MTSKKKTGVFTTLLMGFGDKLYFGTPDNVAQGTDQDTQGDADVKYGAHRLIMQYNQRLAPGPDAAADTVRWVRRVWIRCG